MSSINAKAQADMFRFILKGKGALQKLTKTVLVEVGRRLVDYSAVGNPPTWHPPYWPKGYVPGLFINNWQVGVDNRPVGVVTTIDASGSGSLARMAKAIPRYPVGHVFYFVNNLPYARLLETGLHSPQVGPQGMVGRVVLEYPQIARQAEVDYAKQED